MAIWFKKPQTPKKAPEKKMHSRFCMLVTDPDTKEKSLFTYHMDTTEKRILQDGIFLGNEEQDIEVYVLEGHENNKISTKDLAKITAPNTDSFLLLRAFRDNKIPDFKNVDTVEASKLVELHKDEMDMDIPDELISVRKEFNQRATPTRIAPRPTDIVM